MPTTDNGLPYPDLADSNNPPADIQALAEAVDARYGFAVANYAALAALSPWIGMQVWLNDQAGYATWNGLTWLEPDLIGTGTFTTSAHVASGLATYTIGYGTTRAAAPRWVHAQFDGFVSNSSQLVIKGVVARSTTDFGVTVLNTGPSAVTATNVPVRFRVAS